MLLQIKSTFYDFQGELYQGAATGGATTSLTDSGLIGYTSEMWPTRIVGQQFRVTGGSASGDLRMAGRFDPSDGIIYPNRSFSAAVASTDTYELWGNAINGGSPLTNLFNMVLRGLRPVTETQMTIVTNQNVYDLTTVVQSRRDIRAIEVRNLDPANLAPYRVNVLTPGLEWTAYDRGGAGTTSVVLELTTPITRDDTTVSLWIRGDTGFAALSTDTSTVDAVYRDWIAWEGVLELCQRKLSVSTADSRRWKQLLDRAAFEVSSWRARWIPREPVPIATF